MGLSAAISGALGVIRLLRWPYNWAARVKTKGEQMDIFADTDQLAQPSAHDSKARRKWWTAPVPATLLVAVLIATGFTAYQRIGTLANVDVVETTRNLGGGFMAVGMTENQAGFLLVSALEKKDVTIDAERHAHFLAGSRTRLRVETSTRSWSKRLRKPVVITIDGHGHIETTTVDWPRHTFQTLADAADCEHASPLHKKHCGAPFVDIRARVAKWPLDTIPVHLRTFLAAR